MVMPVNFVAQLEVSFLGFSVCHREKSIIRERPKAWLPRQKAAVLRAKDQNPSSQGEFVEFNLERQRFHQATQPAV